MILGMVVGALLFATGWFIGFVNGRTERRLKQEAVKPICACGHTIGSHFKRGKCKVTVYQVMNGRDTEAPCACTEYFGPIPATDVFMPPTFDPQDQTS